MKKRPKTQVVDSASPIWQQIYEAAVEIARREGATVEEQIAVVKAINKSMSCQPSRKTGQEVKLLICELQGLMEQEQQQDQLEDIGAAFDRLIDYCREHDVPAAYLTNRLVDAGYHRRDATEIVRGDL